MSKGNTKLVEYGIHNEDSDYRAHVCVLAKTVYIYKTENGVNTIDKKQYRSVPVYTGNIQTAKGFLVPPFDIEGCISIESKYDWSELFDEKQTTTQKGEKATYVVENLIKAGRIPFVLDPENVTDFDLQIKGIDIIISASLKIQVKCDYKGGERERGGTGNLFLQTHECNPFGYI